MPTINVQKIAQLTGHNASVFALAPDADAQHFLSAAGDGWIVRWDLEKPDVGKLIAKVETQIFSLLNLPDLNKLVVGNMNGGVHWIDLENPDETKISPIIRKAFLIFLEWAKVFLRLVAKGKSRAGRRQKGSRWRVCI